MNSTDTIPPSSSVPQRRWPVALLVAFVTGLVGALMAVPISDWAMEAHHVSTMEGGRACAAVAIWAPLAFIIGFATGFFVGLQLRGARFAGYLKRQAVALLIIAALVATGGAIGYATADHPPLIDNHPLALEIEVRVPSNGRSIEDLRAADFDVALVVSISDRNYAYLRWKEAVQTDEFITVPAWAPLNSRDAGREITARVRNESPQIFNVMRRASPKTIDDAWSDWAVPRQRFDGSKP
ncbi:MAG: hypothetical protein ABR526_10635, partial [Chthoniobacterales bacterium]